MDSIRVTAKTVSDAITEASIQLETSSDNIEYTIIDEGSKGFFGIGSRKAMIEARKKFTDEDLMQEVFGEKKEKAEKLGVEAYRLSFTTETEKETEKIARAFVEVYLRGQKPDGWMQTEETTKGHFQRGVE